MRLKTAAAGLADRETSPDRVDNRLGTYLRDRRLRLDPEALGYEREARRTAGLRREEVAQRARVSPTWYTWLEQGRGDLPSATALDRLAAALQMTVAEREHLFILAQRRPPPASSYRSSDDIPPGLRRLIDALTTSRALVKTAASDLIA